MSRKCPTRRTSKTRKVSRTCPTSGIVLPIASNLYKKKSNNYNVLFGIIMPMLLKFVPLNKFIFGNVDKIGWIKQLLHLAMLHKLVG